jgi:hypothetical protein
LNVTSGSAFRLRIDDEFSSNAVAEPTQHQRKSTPPSIELLKNSLYVNITDKKIEKSYLQSRLVGIFQSLV